MIKLKDIIIYGNGGHAKVVKTACKDNYVVKGQFDDSITEEGVEHGVWKGRYDHSKFEMVKLIVAIGDNGVRKNIVSKVKHRFTSIIAKTAIIEESVVIGEGGMILQGSIVQVDTKLGKHVIVNTGASIDHDCQIGDFVHIAPGSVLCGNVSVGQGTLIGARSVVLPGVSIGQNVKVGAGTVVHRNVPDGATVVGNPGRIISN